MSDDYTSKIQQGINDYLNFPKFENLPEKSNHYSFTAFLNVNNALGALKVLSYLAFSVPLGIGYGLKKAYNEVKKIKAQPLKLPSLGGQSFQESKIFKRALENPDALPSGNTSPFTSSPQHLVIKRTEDASAQPPISIIQNFYDTYGEQLEGKQSIPEKLAFLKEKLNENNQNLETVLKDTSILKDFFANDKLKPLLLHHAQETPSIQEKVSEAHLLSIAEEIKENFKKYEGIGIKHFYSKSPLEPLFSQSTPVQSDHLQYAQSDRFVIMAALLERRFQAEGKSLAEAFENPQVAQSLHSIGWTLPVIQYVNQAAEAHRKNEPLPPPSSDLPQNIDMQAIQTLIKNDGFETYLKELSSKEKQ